MLIKTAFVKLLNVQYFCIMISCFFSKYVIFDFILLIFAISINKYLVLNRNYTGDMV